MMGDETGYSKGPFEEKEAKRQPKGKAGAPKAEHSKETSRKHSSDAIARSGIGRPGEKEPVAIGEEGRTRTERSSEHRVHLNFMLSGKISEKKGN